MLIFVLCSNLFLFHTSLAKDLTEYERLSSLDLNNDSSLNDDTISIVTGAINVESIQTIITQQRTSTSNTTSRSSDTLSFSLNLPDLNRDTDDDTILFSFDCEQGMSNEDSDTSFFRCTNQQQRRRRRHPMNINTPNNAVPPPPVANAFIGTNDEGVVTGLIESDSVRYEIKSRIERDDEGNYSNLSYTYAAAKSSDLYYVYIYPFCITRSLRTTEPAL